MADGDEEGCRLCLPHTLLSSVSARLSWPGGGRSRSPKLAEDLGISESCLRNWVTQADINDGRREGLTSDERAELVKLCREKRVLEMEVEILKRASAYFARENILPK